MLPRTLEPEVMDTEEDASEYDLMNHEEVNRRFVADWGAACQQIGMALDRPLLMLDVGTGTARIPIALCQRYSHVTITAIDLADEMLKLARINIARAELSSRITLQRVDGKQLPFSDGAFDSVVTNTILHHIPEPLVCLREMVRVLAPGGLLFVRDLMRPESDSAVESLVNLHTQGATPSQRQLFRQSLHASLTLGEVRDMLEELRLPTDWVQATSDRHWTLCGRTG
ncbi:MAG: class I SAM-dependent methyltransferase [Planctomycetaceae bacterium]